MRFEACASNSEVWAGARNVHTHMERKSYTITPPVAQNSTTITGGKDLLHETDISLGIKSRGKS